MVEREPRLRTLAPYLTEAAGGHGRLVFVGGEAGGGKSTFVPSFVARAGDAARSGFGACDGSSTPAPLEPLVDLLPALPADVWPAGATSYEVFTRILDGTESIELAMVCSNQAHLRMLGGDLAGTRSWAARSLDLLGRLPDSRRRTEVRAHVLTNLGTAEALSGDETMGRQMLEESLAEAMSAELHHEHARATAHLEAGIEYCLERDLDTWWTYLQGCRAQLLLDRGEVAAARTCAEDVLRRPGVAPLSRTQPLTVLARARARAGDERWREPLERAAVLAEGGPELQRLSFVAAARCEAAWFAGDPEAARREAERVWRVARDGESPWLRGWSRPGCRRARR